jgi:hypothetical protein
MSMRVGDWVEVRSKEEILATLDSNGRVEGLPFMPQMFEYCGQRFQIFKSAHKTCDTVNGPSGSWFPHGIHLDLRCDGKAYGGCDAACLIFWKEMWLRPVAGKDAISDTISYPAGVGCSEQDVLKGTSVVDDKGPRYQCQAVCMPASTSKMPWWDLRQYAQDFRSGNASLSELFQGFLFATYWHATQAFRHRFGLGAPGRWLYDRFQAIRGGTPFPFRLGLIPKGKPTPVSDLNLQPGELVRVKSHKEILATINVENRNNGMGFDVEMVPYCGKTYKVKTRINTFIDEKTGRRKSLRTPAVILEDVWCRGCFSRHRMGCPRSIYSWWREAWLERVDEGSVRAPGEQASHSRDAPRGEDKQPGALHGEPARTHA